jgi:hypothetical protein
MTLHELAAEYGVSAERIRQIEVAAMKKMRKALEPAAAGPLRRAQAGLSPSRQQLLQVVRQRLGAACRSA